MDSKGQKAGKGPLIAEEISNTLGTSQDQYLFQPVDKFVLDDQGGSVIHWRWDGKSPCLRAQMGGHTPVVLESHPNDSRVKIDDSGSIQTLTSRMGTGGGNVPMVMMPFSKSRRAKSAEDFETWKESRVSNTINTFDQGDVRATDVVVCIQGNVIDRSDNAGANGAGWRTDKCYTLNTIDRPAVAYATGNGQMDNMTLSDKFGALDCMHDQKIVVLAIDRAAFNQGENAKYDFQVTGGGTAQTLIARGPGAVCYCRGLQKPKHNAGYLRHDSSQGKWRSIVKLYQSNHGGQDEE